MGSYKEQNYETKTMIAGALRKLMKRKDFNKITVREIIEECGVARNTFYYHFECTTDLLSWMVKEEVLNNLNLFKTDIDLKIAINFVVRYVLSNKDIIKSAIESISYRELQYLFENDFIRIISKNVDNIIEENHYIISESFKKYFIKTITTTMAALVSNVALSTDNEPNLNIDKHCQYIYTIITSAILSTLADASRQNL